MWAEAKFLKKHWWQSAGTDTMNPQTDFGADYGAGSLVMTTEAQNQLSQQLKAYRDNIIFVLKVANLGNNSKNDHEFCQHLYNLHATV